MNAKQQQEAIKAYHGPDAFSGTIRMHPWRDHAERISERLSTLAAPGELRVALIEEGHFYAQSERVIGRADCAMARAVRIFGGEWGLPLEAPPAEQGRDFR